jgi:hypothetical protein
MVSPEPDLSPESRKQQKRLHKEHKETKQSGGGLRKLFGRKNRSSKLPENAAADLNGMLAQKKQHDQPAPTSMAATAPATPRDLEPEPALPTPTPAEAYVTPFEDPQRTPLATTPGSRTPTAQMPEPTYEPSVGESISRVDTEDAHEAQQEFSRFDQGPLDQPAFVPDDDSSVDDAIPPPIARHAVEDAVPPPIARRPKEPEVPAAVTPEPVVEEPSQALPVQDRWAQIRKNAAERAAQRQSEDHVSRGGKTTDGDDDTSGEESKLLTTTTAAKTHFLT